MINPFTVFEDDLYLLALLRAANGPEYDFHEARPYLDGLVGTGYLKNAAKSWNNTPWWRLTKKGKDVWRGFVHAHGDEKENFLKRTYGTWPSRW